MRSSMARVAHGAGQSGPETVYRSVRAAGPPRIRLIFRRGRCLASRPSIVRWYSGGGVVRRDSLTPCTWSSRAGVALEARRARPQAQAAQRLVQFALRGLAAWRRAFALRHASVSHRWTNFSRSLPRPAQPVEQLGIGLVLGQFVSSNASSARSVALRAYSRLAASATSGLEGAW